MKIRPWLVAMLVCSWLVGCGPSPAPVDGGDGDPTDAGTEEPMDAASDPTDAGGDRPDGGEPSDAGEDPTDGGEPSDAGEDPTDGGTAAGKLGTVSVTQGDNAGLEGSVTVVAGAFFPDVEVTPELLDGSGSPCPATAIVGSCGFYTCAGTAGANAGTLTAEVEGEAISTLATPGAGGIYFELLPERVAEPGDRVTLRASGDEVPAFTAELTMPGELTATLPSTVSRDAPLTLTWSASGASRTQVTVGAGTDSVVCLLEGSASSVTIDESLLAMLPAGTGTLAVTAFNFDVVEAGDFRVLATTGQGATASPVTLE